MHCEVENCVCGELFLFALLIEVGKKLSTFLWRETPGKGFVWDRIVVFVHLGVGLRSGRLHLARGRGVSPLDFSKGGDSVVANVVGAVVSGERLCYGGVVGLPIAFSAVLGFGA